MGKSKKVLRPNFWFVPIRRGCNEAQFLMEADSLEEAVARLKELPDYVANYNNLPLDDCKRMHGYIEFEENFMRTLNRKVERLPEKVPDCENRVGKNPRGECLCQGIKEHTEPLCIIHQPYFKFELPKNCPYLSRTSKYVSFQDEGAD
jgi:hypothetical protein